MSPPPPPPPRRRHGADDAQHHDDQAPGANESPDDPRLNPDDRSVGVVGGFGTSGWEASLRAREPAPLFAPLPKPDVPRPAPLAGGPTPPRQVRVRVRVRGGVRVS